jgi:hypothetical protein
MPSSRTISANGIEDSLIARLIGAVRVTERERAQQERRDEVNAALIGFLKNQ